MLEGLATWILNTYLGQYLENLNTDQLSIGLLKGEVELENIPLRKDALRHLDMSLEVRAGFVGKVKLQIPVARLRSEPWIIVFEQLYLVAGPIDLNEYDEEAEDNANLGRKMSELDNIEAIWRSEQESMTSDSSYYGSSYSSWLSYGTSFISNILENIQLKIQDVHIRYEDDLSKPGELFACGFTIESLTMQSSDQHWVPKFVYAGDKSMSYKLLELKNFGIYWDSCTEIFSNKSIGELAALMVSSINGGDHDYVLAPVSASACLKRNLSPAPLRSRSSPRFTCDLKLEKFPLFLNDLQYNQITSSLRFYHRLETARPYRKWRPRNPAVKGNAREWWNYAIQCHLDKIHRKYKGRKWDLAFERAKDIRKYVSIYCEHLRNPIKVSVEMQVHKSKVEQELSFEELRILRDRCMEIVVKELAVKSPSKEVGANSPPASAPPSEALSPSSTGSGEGVLQSWFPAWGGWYSSYEEEGVEETPEEVAEEERPTAFKPRRRTRSDEGRGSASSLEEEILYVISDSVENNTFMKRDAVFAQLSFSLKRGNITLSRVAEHPPQPPHGHKDRADDKCLFELEFSSVKVAFESRPRNQSFSFDIELGSMSLKDQVTESTSFPLLISQQRDASVPLKGGRGGAPPFATSTMYARLSSMISSVSRLSPSVSPAPPPAGGTDPLFSLSYEKRPNRMSKTDHRLVITSQALDIVYNQDAFGAITDFFFPLSLRQDEEQIVQAWTASARQRYEELKQHTKEELKKNWETVIQGIMTMERKRWDIQLDISAPQIIVPEHFQDQNATIVILDFGKLMFCTSQQKEEGASSEKYPSSDDEDAFATPCSTPEEFLLKEEQDRTFSTAEEPTVTESNFHQHMYDKFDLKLCDMQVLVAKVKDNWRFAYQKGTGPMHVIDRFNINLHLERRVLKIIPDAPSTSGDPQWPHLMLTGSLPQLVVHINEQKVQAFRNICNLYLRTPHKNQHAGPTCRSTMDGGKMEDDDGAPGSSLPRSGTLTSLLQGESFDQSFKEAQPDAKLIVTQFNVEKLSIELQSRGRSVAELQVTGVRAQVSWRPTDTSASLSVHSLLLVDALQTFGSDFELLVASHKHISMDSVSGSLLDSEPCSPTSPASPDASIPGKPTSPVALSQALNSLASNRAQSPLGERGGYLRSPPGLVSPPWGAPSPAWRGEGLGGPHQHRGHLRAGLAPFAGGAEPGGRIRLLFRSVQRA